MNERPQRRSAAPGSAGGVGVYRGEWSPSGDFLFPFPPGPFSLTAAFPPRCFQASPSPVPESFRVSTAVRGRRLLWASCRKLLAAGPLQGNYRFPSSARIVSRKAPLGCPLPLLLRGRQELGTAEPKQHLLGADLDSLLIEAASWAGLLWRLQVRDGGGSGGGGGWALLSVARPSSGPRANLGSSRARAGAAGL